MTYLRGFEVVEKIHTNFSAPATVRWTKAEGSLAFYQQNLY